MRSKRLITFLLIAFPLMAQANEKIHSVEYYRQKIAINDTSKIEKRCREFRENTYLENLFIDAPTIKMNCENYDKAADEVWTAFAHGEIGKGKWK